MKVTSFICLTHFHEVKFDINLRRALHIYIYIVPEIDQFISLYWLALPLLYNEEQLTKPFPQVKRRTCNLGGWSLELNFGLLALPVLQCHVILSGSNWFSANYGRCFTGCHISCFQANNPVAPLPFLTESQTPSFL